LAFNAPHTPFHNPPSNLHDYPTYDTDVDGNVTGADRRGAYEASLQALDTELGRLFETVDLDNTNIILIGDNGTPGAVVQAPYSSDHAKGSLYEGGVHVPLIMAGPDVTRTGLSNKIVHCVDLFSTILELADIDVASATADVDTIDSKSLIPILNGQDSVGRCVVSERFNSATNNNGRSIRSDDYPDYRLIIFGDPTDPSDTSTYEMYHVVDDVNQQFPLTIPAVFGDAHYYAYNALIAKDVDLGPTEVVVSGDTIYLHLVESSGPSSAPQNPNLAPTSIDIDGVSATYLGRFNQADGYNRFWVKCTLPNTSSAPYTTASVTFTNVPMGNATRVLAVTEIIVVP
jgi:arylsulfatase A-like enzyme